MLNQNMLILEALWVCVTCIYVIHFNLNHNFHFRSENILMAHERIEVDLPLAKVYELLNNPVHYTKFLERIDTIEKVNSQTFTYITEDRKSTRLNSSHVAISYAVFCLKKKKQN